MQVSQQKNGNRKQVKPENKQLHGLQTAVYAAGGQAGLGAAKQFAVCRTQSQPEMLHVTAVAA